MIENNKIIGSMLSDDEIVTGLNVKFGNYTNKHQELILVTKLLYHLILEFESVFQRVNDIISGLGNDDSMNMKNVLQSEINEYSSMPTKSSDYLSFITMENKEFDNLNSKITKAVKVIGDKPKRDIVEIKELRLILEKKVLFCQKELLNKQAQLYEIERDLFNPVVKFGEVFNDLLFYNESVGNEDVLQEVNKTVSRISVILRDYRSLNLLKSNTLSARFADYNLEELIGGLIDKYSIQSHFDNINLFYRIDKDLPSNIIGEKLIAENIISLLFEMSIIYLKITDALIDSTSMKKIELILNTVVDKNNKSRIRLSIINSGLSFKQKSLSSIYKLFSIYEDDYPFAELKIKLIEGILKIDGGELEMSNVDSKPCFSCMINYEVL